jgi:hypothetical protein
LTQSIQVYCHADLVQVRTGVPIIELADVVETDPTSDEKALRLAISRGFNMRGESGELQSTFCQGETSLLALRLKSLFAHQPTILFQDVIQENSAVTQKIDMQDKWTHHTNSTIGV